jgi:hypothetical protein
MLEEFGIELQLEDLTRDWEKQSYGLLYHSARRNGHNRQQGAGSFIESNIEGDMVRGVAYQNSSPIKDPDQRRIQLRADTAWISKQDCTVVPTTDRFSQGAMMLTGGQAIPPALEQGYYKSVDGVVSTDTPTVQAVAQRQG